MSSLPLRRLILSALCLLTLAAPMRAHATEPPLGEAVTLEDGSVLPPMPAELMAPSVQSEQLAEHGGHEPAVGAVQGPDAAGGTGNDAGGAVASDELRVAAGGAAGPGGPLPNGLRREVLGFLPYWELDSASVSALRFDLLSTIAYFSIGVEADGSLNRGSAAAPSSGWAGWTSSAMTGVMNAAHARGVRVVPTITLMSWNGDYAKLDSVLNNPTHRARVISEVVTMIRGRRADGVNVDFEPVPSSLRSQFTGFVREMKAGLVNAGVGSYLTVDTMAGAAAWASGYDVVGLTAPGAADALMVMAYDFSYAGSARAGGVAPLESDYLYASADAMRDHLARVPGSKLIWGIPYYGRAWNTQTDAQNSPVRTPSQSVAFSYFWRDADGVAQGGAVLAARHGRRWDATGQVPWFSFWDANSNGPRQGYYEDPQSLRIKYDHVVRNRVAGVGIWALGMDTGSSDLWNVLRERFVKVVGRQAGADRYATAAAVSAASFSAGVPAAYVATGATFPDALAAGPIAARAGGPVLLTAGGSLPAATASELARLRPVEIVVLGGTGAVSDSVLDALRPYATSGTVHRIGGADRYATAAAVSAWSFSAGVPVAYVATGATFPDALAGGVAAGRGGGPILLVSRDTLPAATAAELTRLQPARIVVIGGPGAVSDSVLDALRSHTTGTVSRLAGADRYATAVAISQATTAADTDGTVYVATGIGFPDGLAGTPPAILADAPLLTIPGNRLPSGVAAELVRINPARVIVLGGPGAVSDALMNAIRLLWD